MPSREQRRLAAIVAADVVGYSRLMGRDEAGTLARLKEHRVQRLEPALARNSGRLVKLTGDGALAEFGSAVDALRAAIEFQQAVDEANTVLPEDQRIVFRVGLHVGDLIVEGDDLYGDGVNVAARLEGEAPAGGIVVSGTARDFVGERIKARFADLGELALKNIERPLRAWRIEWNAADWKPAAPAAPEPDRRNEPVVPALILPDKPSIAVLPFQNMSGDPEQEYFADGMVEDIITALSRFSSLFVIARNSSFTYKGRGVDVRQVGRELGVRYVLEGSVRRSGNRLRITGQLVDARTGGHLWAEQYDGDMGDVFALQDRIAEAVSGTIAPTIEQSEIDRARRMPARNLDAYDTYLRALPQLYEMTRESIERSTGLFEQALALDPTFVPALLGASRSLLVRVGQGWVSWEAVGKQGLDYVERALRLDKDNAEVLASVGRARSFIGGATDESLGLVKRAVALNPNSAFAWMNAGWVHIYAAESDAALDHFQRAIRLSPRDPNNFETLTGLSHALIQLKRDEEAIDVGRWAVQQAPNFAPAWRGLIAALGHCGRTDEAHAVIGRLLENDPSLTVRSFEMRRSPATRKGFVRIYEGMRLAGLPE